MGWVHDEPGDDLYDHEGYCVAVLGNGSEPPPVQQPFAGPDGEARASGNSSWWLYDGKEGRPRAVTVRAGCACGWRSADMFPADFTDQEATEGFEYNDGPFAAWEREHIGQLLGTAVPAELREAISTVWRMLGGLTVSRPLAAITAASDLEKLSTPLLQEAVKRARQRGESWDAIGKAAGVSRQAAHQRFAKVSLPQGSTSPAS
ncbi:hypothetical protein [Streptomyces sp. NPDC001274]